MNQPLLRNRGHLVLSALAAAVAMATAPGCSAHVKQKGDGGSASCAAPVGSSACDDCRRANCCAEESACDADEGCRAAKQCLSVCSSLSCAESCVQGSALYAPLAACVDDACRKTCTEEAYGAAASSSSAASSSASGGEPVCAPDGICTPGEMGAQECGGGVCCGNVCVAGTGGCPSFWVYVCNGSPACQTMEEVCQSQADCCHAEDVCVDFGPDTRCEPPCASDSDCASDCCVPLDGGGRVCAPSSLSGDLCPGGATTECNEASCPSGCVGSGDYLCCNACAPTCATTCFPG